jgi:pyrophosphate--fructose-6-phosphate 1-phosphotransferase
MSSHDRSHKDVVQARAPDGAPRAAQVYSEMVGNIMIDAASARKYTHFVRLMGRSASHLTLETALQTHPQAALICEEITATRTTLAGVTQQARARRPTFHA